MAEPGSADLNCDILLLVATTTEREELRAAAREFGLPFRKRRHLDRRYYSLGVVGATRVNAMQVEMGPFGHGGSASVGIRYQAETGASGLIQLGMAFGVDRSRQALGDVLVSTHLYPYDDRTVNHVPDGYWVDYSGVRAQPASSPLIEVCRRYAASRSAGDYRVFTGGMLTGGARIHARAFVEEMRRTLPLENDGDPVGGEMEGAGLLSISPHGEACWIVVKGISDFADEFRDHEVQAARSAACRNAARFVLHALGNWPESTGDHILGNGP